MSDFRARTVHRLEEVLERPLGQWPAGEPLVNLLGPGYDSMRRLQVLLALDAEFGLNATPTAGDLETIEAIVQFVATSGRTSR